MKHYIFAFFALVIAFILSATIFGQYHSALSVIIGFGTGFGYAELIKRKII